MYTMREAVNGKESCVALRPTSTQALVVATFDYLALTAVALI